MKVILFVVLLTVSIVIAHEEHALGSKIDAIIEKHYKKYLESLPSEQRNEVKSETASNWKHECMQDTLIENHFNKKLNKLQDLNSKNPSTNGKSVNEKQATWSAIRFNVNSTLVTTSLDVRACKTAGSRVAFGTPSNTNDLCSDGQSDCWYTCTSQDIVSSTLQNVFRNNIVPAVLEIFEDTLTIQPVQGNLKLNRDVWEAYGSECYEDVPIPSSIVNGIGTGAPNSDMMVYVTVRPAPSANTVAYALTCNYDYTQQGTKYIFSRPLAGLINFAPQYFQQFSTGTYSQFDFRSAVKVGVHEFTHALGFNSGYYSSYLDKTTGQPYTTPPARVSRRTGQNANGTPYSVNISYIQTPTVVKVAADHYACPTADGLELEDFGGAGTAGSHWDARVVLNEYMAGVINALMPVSYMTLALFDDMGWYNVDYTAAEKWFWGKDRGCPFIQSAKCETSWPIDGRTGYLCTDSSVSGCTADRFAKGTCNLRRYSNQLPVYYQHFQDGTLGGVLPYADYCSYIDADRGGGAGDSFCADTSLTPDSTVSEVFGTNSLCWEIAPNSNTLPATSPKLSCYVHRCTDGVLEVQIGATWISCPVAGGTVAATPLNGIINCPSSSLICRQVSVGEDTTSDSSSIVVSALILAIAVLL